MSSKDAMEARGYGKFNRKPDDPPPPLPVIPRCDGFDCFERANPAWRDGSRTFCRNCAPDNLKRPSSQEYRDVEETRSR